VPIHYALEVEPGLDARAEYALRLLLDGIGIAARRVASAAEADLVYARERPAELAPPALWIRQSPVSDWSHPKPAQIDELTEDVVFATYTVVTGAFEQGHPRDAWGVPVGNGNALAASVWRRPLAAVYCDRLRRALEECRGAELRPQPQWPGGKRYAVIVSHDVDVPFTRAPWSFYGRRLARNVARRAPRAAVRGARLPDPADDPNFCFPAWAELESSVGARSCFYVAVTSSADPLGSAYDVDYDYRHPAIVRALHDALERGCEIGLHASINAHRIDGRIAEERALLERILHNHPVEGVRHHYWALDPEHPEATLDAHAKAGFVYDSSLGLNDTPGFRRGMVWPFTPFDPRQEREVVLLEVPPTLMDGAVFYRSVTAEEGRRRIEGHVDAVKAAGGAAVFDWHLEQLNPSRLHGAGGALADVLRSLAGDSDVHWTTPIEAARWWRERRARIESG
jgi:hypothetical protein